MNKVFCFLKHFKVTGLCSLLVLGTKHGSASESKPNIIIILTDDQGYQDLGCYGSPDIKTPHIDQMAKEGMKLTAFYSASPVCSPSRAALMTGCYPERVGVPKVLFPNRADKGLSPEHTTIAEVLKTKGYATMAVGKWHLGDEKPYLPTNQGFDAYYGIPYSNDMFPAKSMEYDVNCNWREGYSAESLNEIFESQGGDLWSISDNVPLMKDEVCIEFPADQSTITKRYTDEVLKFIKASYKQKKPFFLYLSHSMPHTPLFASADFKGKSKRGLYGDVIEEIDHNVGRLTKELKQLGLEENTIVVYTSDNGPWLIKGNYGGSALPLFEGKMTYFEGGQRVPCIIKWPAKVPAMAVSDELITMMDLFPTFAHVTGASLPNDIELDGKNAMHIFSAKDGAKSAHDYFFYGSNAVRKNQWKYHEKEVFKVKKTKRKTQGPSLYNLNEDIGESLNLVENPENIAIVEELSKALENHKKRLKAQ